MRLLSNLSLLALILLLLISCKDKEDDTIITIPPDTTVDQIIITTSQTNFVIGIDTNVVFAAKAINAAGEDLAGKAISWSSSDAAIATIDNSGTLTLHTPGMTMISASSEGKQSAVEITVTNEPKPQITIVSTQTEFMLGDLTIHRLQAVVIDENGQLVTNPIVFWESWDDAIISIAADGTITIHALGEVDITATYMNAQTTEVFHAVAPSGTGDFNIKTADGIFLRANMDLPTGAGPFPAVAMIHGSGTATRASLKVFADILKGRGIAVLRYDKRGTGESGGTFFEVGPSSSGTGRINQLALDALDCLAFMKLHTAVAADKSGLFGFSQGGWITPRAAVQSNEIAFIVNIVGPVCTVGEEIYYSNLIAGGASVESANNQVSNFSGTHGYDPVPDLESIDIAGLWVLGGQDGSIPTAVSIERLDVLIANGKLFDIHLKPTGNHFLIDVNTGQQISYLSPPGGVIDWIMEQVN